MRELTASGQAKNLVAELARKGFSVGCSVKERGASDTAKVGTITAMAESGVQVGDEMVDTTEFLDKYVIVTRAEEAWAVHCICGLRFGMQHGPRSLTMHPISKRFGEHARRAFRVHTRRARSPHTKSRTSVAVLSSTPTAHQLTQASANGERARLTKIHDKHCAEECRAQGSAHLPRRACLPSPMPPPR